METSQSWKKIVLLVVLSGHFSSCRQWRILPDGEIDHNFSCPEQQGLFANPENCSYFYNCWQGQAFVQHCPENLLFNPLTKQCDYHHLVQCDTNPQETLQEDACGSNRPLITTRPLGIIQSHRSALGKYYSNVTCSWLITAPQGHVISILSHSFNIENSKDCLKDSLTIYDGVCSTAKSLGKFCGRSIQTSLITSSKNGILVEFKTDEQNEFEGFELEFKAKIDLDPPPLPPAVIANNDVACSSLRPLHTSASHGIITSPGFDEGLTNYPSDSLCVWKILAPPGQFVRTNFSFFRLEGNWDCGLDALIFYDGPATPDRLIGAYCGLIPPVDLISYSNELTVVFVSDFVRNYPGFKMEYYFTMEPKRCEIGEMMCESDKTCIGNERKCDGFDDCDRGGDDEENCIFDPNPATKCGKQVFQPYPGNSRIIGGREAKPGSWPWQAGLYSYGIFTCGGALISESWVVTAAHCFKRDPDVHVWTVSLGSHHSLDIDKYEQRRKVTKRISHPHYQPVQPAIPPYIFRENDIALLLLDRPVQFSDYVIPICLPPPNDVNEEMEMCIVTGWGETRNFSTMGVLMQAQLPLISDDECALLYPNKTAQSMLCAGWPQGGHDACQGDSGGPFVCPQSDQSWKLAGVVSWGIDCGVAGQPSVNTEVTYHLKWIMETMNNETV